MDNDVDGQTPAPEQPPAAQQVPVNLQLELPNDLLMGAAQALQRPPEAVAQVLMTVIGQMIVRGLGIRVGQPPPQSQIAIARGMPPPIQMPRGPRL